MVTSIHEISIIAPQSGEAESIISACKFFPDTPKNSFRIYCPLESLAVQKSEVFHLHHLSSLPEINNLAVSTIVFASFGSFCVAENLKEVNTLFVNKNLAILLVSGSIKLPDSFYLGGQTPCCLKDDPAIKQLESLRNMVIYPDSASYLLQKHPSEVLVTSNQDLVKALVTVNSHGWIIWHPEISAFNLGMDFSSEPTSLIMNGISRFITMPDVKQKLQETPYSLEVLRKAMLSEEHAYSFFALHYDEYMSHVNYNFWVTHLLTWYKQYSTNKLNKIFELACGTANVASRLVMKGYEVHASDLSKEMLQVASLKTNAPQLYCKSLTDPIPGNDYQLILCMFDSINYLLTFSHIFQALTNVHSALEPGGLFIFDISTLLNSEENFSDVTNVTNTKDGYLMHKAWFDETRMSQTSRLIYFQKEQIGYSYHQEQHSQRVYFCSELITVIEKSPLSLKAIHSTDTPRNLYPKRLSEIDQKYYRLFFVLQKN